MKFLITGPNGRILRRRLYTTDPRTIEGLTFPPQVVVHEIDDADAPAVDLVLDSLAQNEHATYIDGVAAKQEVVDVVAGMPFRRQLNTVMRSLAPAVRQKVADIIGPGLALDDPEVMAAALNGYDVSDKPARVQKLKADVMTVIGREVAKRQRVTP